MGDKLETQPYVSGDFPNPSPDQQFVMEKFSRAVGKVLTLVEAVLPEGQQCDAFKKGCEDIIYILRADMLKRFK